MTDQEARELLKEGGWVAGLGRAVSRGAAGVGRGMARVGRGGARETASARKFKPAGKVKPAKGGFFGRPGRAIKPLPAPAPAPMMSPEASLKKLKAMPRASTRAGIAGEIRGARSRTQVGSPERMTLRGVTGMAQKHLPKISFIKGLVYELTKQG